MSEQCLQYKEQYEKLLELKRGFDEVLAEGERTRDFTEVKIIRTELEKAIVYLERYLKLKVWKTIELGTGLKNADDFIQALEDGGCKIDNSVKSVLENSKFIALSEKTKFELVVVSVADLDFPNGATTEEIYKRAKEMGLELCPPEVGPQLRLQYKDQPRNETLRIAVEPIKNSNGTSCVWGVGLGSNLWLDARYESSGFVWRAGCRWVFVKRKLKE